MIRFPGIIAVGDVRSGPWPDRVGTGVDRGQRVESRVEEFARQALDAVTGRRGPKYADVRVQRQRIDQISTRDGALEGAGEQLDTGFGIRVLVDGAWGFAAHSRLEPEAIPRVAAAALEAARAATRVNPTKVELAPNPPAVAVYQTPMDDDRDPFAVSLEEKQALLLEAEAAMRAPSGARTGQIQVTRTEYLAFQTEKLFCSSEGACIRQEITECGVSLFALATGEAKPARRTFANYAQGGWRFVERLDLPARAAQIGDEAISLLAAPYVEPGPTDIVLGSSQLALMVHETCGHPTELDRVLGFEDAFAGGSFLQPGDRGELRYGSPHVSLSADSTLPGGLGTFGYDDDGVAAQRFPLVEQGIFTGYLCSRETAPMIGLDHSTGCSRADGWGRIPIVRMVNVSLDPGEVPLDDLIGGVEHGLFLDTPSSWSLDDKRLNFHFGMEYAREIRHGKLGPLRRGATMQNITPRFWGSCDGVAARDHWQLWGFLSCAKGEPIQLLHVGHGAAPARFRHIDIGVEQ